MWLVHLSSILGYSNRFNKSLTHLRAFLSLSYLEAQVIMPLIFSDLPGNLSKILLMLKIKIFMTCKQLAVAYPGLRKSWKASTLVNSIKIA